eukprot:790333-Pleurochrysis_carterae.AAC.1
MALRFEFRRSSSARCASSASCAASSSRSFVTAAAAAGFAAAVRDVGGCARGGPRGGLGRSAVHEQRQGITWLVIKTRQDAREDSRRRRRRLAECTTWGLAHVAVLMDYQVRTLLYSGWGRACTTWGRDRRVTSN